MLKKYEYKILLALIALGFLFIPVADTRVFGSIPLYPLDFISLLILSTSAFFLANSKLFKEKKFLNIGILLGAVLISSFLSCLVNEPTRTSLGQLKSWFLLPSTASILFAFVSQYSPQRNRDVLRFWFLGISMISCLLVPYVILQDLTFDGRLQGLFTSPNFLAFFLFPGALLSFYFWQHSLLQSSRVFFSSTGVFFLCALYLTQSFGGWLALGGSFAWYFLKNKEYRRYTKSIFFIACILGIFISVELATGDKLQGIFNERSSLFSRLTIWNVATLALQDNPVFGIGIGNFQSVYLGYQSHFPPYLEWAVPQPHNLFLALWLQAGLVGLLSTIWLVQKALREKSRESSQEQKIFQALFVGMLLYGIFDTPLFGNALGFVWWLVLGVLLFPIQKNKAKMQ